MTKGNIMCLETLLRRLKPRPSEAHKGIMGHVAIMGGDQGMAGAAILAAQAASRMGAGKVTIISRAATLAAALIRQPELMGLACDTIEDLDLDGFDVLAIGPGMGQRAWAHRLLAAVQEHRGYQVWDADALNVLALQAQHQPCNERILTPHPAEAARLLQCSTAEVQADRVAAASELQTLYGGIIVLKGAQTLIASRQQEALQLWRCPYGNAGMASAGMGDVLAGLIVGLLAQKDIIDEADMLFCVQLGVCLHSYSADKIAATDGQRGLLASDIIAVARTLLNQLEVK